MKDRSPTLFSRLIRKLEDKYRAPEECKLVMADKNLITMWKAQTMLIIMGVIGIICILILHKGEYLNYLPRFIYFLTYIVFGIICIVSAARLRKLNFTRSTVKMIPTYFLFVYLIINIQLLIIK